FNNCPSYSRNENNILFICSDSIKEDKNGVRCKGGMDIYYYFETDYGFDGPYNFEEVNSKYDDMNPMVCTAKSDQFSFVSNRPNNHGMEVNFDIYQCLIAIDNENKRIKISSHSNVEQMANINTKYN